MCYSPALAIDKFNTSLTEAGAGTGHEIVTSQQASGLFSNTIGNAIKILLSFVGIIFIILIIYAGYTWMLARGNETEAQKAKDTITRAIIGLFIVLAAYAITAFVGRSIS
jgi:cytochrome bd-type quinol oxidase subunit 2